MANTYRDYSTARKRSAPGHAVKTGATSGSGSAKSGVSSRSGNKELEYYSGKRRSSSSRTQEYSRASSGRPSSSSSSAGIRSGSSKRKKKKSSEEKLITYGLIFVLLLVIVTVVIVVRSCNSKSEPAVVVLDPSSDVMAENVSINGIQVTGMTIDEARAVIQPSVDQDIDKISIQLVGDTFSEEITGEQMEASSNLEEILSSALSGGSNQSYMTSINIDYQALNARVRDINSTLAHGATDASFTLEEDENGKPKLIFTEGVAGMGLDTDATMKLIQDVFESGSFSATLNPVLTTVQPSVTVEDLKAQVTEIGRYSTTYCTRLPSKEPEEDRIIVENRSYNIQKCADIVNGEIVNPGKTWSFNRTVGDRTEKNGWKEAKGIYGGETYNMQFGGGVCQVSTTLYVALMRAGTPYSAVTRRQHSIPSTYVPKGLDATVDSDHIDFKFKNTTEYPIYIFAYTTPTKNRSRYRDINVVIYGKALPENTKYDLRSVIVEEIQPGDPIISYNKKKYVDYSETTVEARTGYVADVYLDTIVNGKTVSSEKIYTDRYEAITQKITVGTIPTPSPTPVPGSESEGGSSESSGSSSGSQSQYDPVYTTPKPGTENNP
ncbi:MAG: VanW family protein [Clostridia bacterium]|nr:VanW family protein [Clostridia bacterium]